MTTDRLTPTWEQMGFIADIVASPTASALSTLGLGVGKTLVAVESALALGAKTILIIAPLSTQPGWRRHFKLQAPDMQFQQLASTKAGKQAITDMQASVPGVYFVGWEYAARLAFKGTITAHFWEKIELDFVCLDEAHRASRRDTKNYKMLLKLRTKFKLAQTATPTGDNFDRAWAIASWLFPEQVTGFVTWQPAFCKQVYDPFAFGHMRTVGEKVEGAFYASLPCVVHADSQFETPKPEVFYVDLYPSQRKIYADLEDTMVTWINDEANRLERSPLTVELPITLRSRLRQATLADLAFDSDGEVSFPDDAKSAKTDVSFGILDDTFEGEPALIGTDSQKFAAYYVKRINAHYGDGTAVEWSGKTSQKAREQVMADFQAGVVKYVVSVFAAAAEGIDGFQYGTRNLLALSQHDSGMLMEQWVGRINRTGQTRPVQYVVMEGVDTVDTDQFKALSEKAYLRRTVLDGVRV